MAELSKELKEIKKRFGEKFMHICRDNFASLLETEGLLTQILDMNFAQNSRSLGDDIEKNDLLISFKDFIYSKIDVESDEKQIIPEKSPYEILDEAGYKLIECTTEAEIQKFRKYYAPNELICTIYNGGRLKSSLVFFAVKKDVAKIKREDFQKPQREDEYGTSVLGIQFDKQGTCMPHIITRYNHTVNNPNGTYGNDLDRIASGLTESFARLLHERGLELNKANIEAFEIPGYTLASDGKYYKYNFEIDGKYYCPGNIIIDGGEIIKLNSDKEVLIDYFILDKEKKTFKLYDTDLKDSFLDSFKNIEKIQMEKNPEKEKQTRIITIQTKDMNLPITIEIDKDNNIIGYSNQELTEVGDDFLWLNEKLTEINLPELTEAGNGFLIFNEQLTKVNLPKLTKVGADFLNNDKQLTEINLPELTEVGDDFLIFNEQLTEINLPKLTKAGDGFLANNKQLTRINLPQLIEVEDEFLCDNKILAEIVLPELAEVGFGFLAHNELLTEINSPKLTKVGAYFLSNNKQLTEINLPKLTEAGTYFLDTHPQKEEIIKNLKNKHGIIIDFNTRRTLLQQKEEELSALEDDEKKISEVEALIKKKMDKENKNIGEQI